MKFDMTTDAKEIINYFNHMKETGSTWKVMNNHFMNIAFYLKTNTLKKTISEFNFCFLDNQQTAIDKYINTPSNKGDAFRISSAQKRLAFLIQNGLDFAKLNKNQQFLQKALYEYQNKDFIELLLSHDASLRELNNIQKGRLISNTLYKSEKINKDIIYLLLENSCQPDCDTLYFIDKYFRMQSVHDFYIIDSPSNNNFIKKLFIDTKKDELLFPNIFSLKPPFQINMFEYAFYKNKELWNILLKNNQNLKIEDALERILYQISDIESRYNILKHVINCDLPDFNFEYFLDIDIGLTHSEKMTIRNISITQQKERLQNTFIDEYKKTPSLRL